MHSRQAFYQMSCILSLRSMLPNTPHLPPGMRGCWGSYILFPAGAASAAEGSKALGFLRFSLPLLCSCAPFQLGLCRHSSLMEPLLSPNKTSLPSTQWVERVCSLWPVLKADHCWSCSWTSAPVLAWLLPSHMGP